MIKSKIVEGEGEQPLTYPVLLQSKYDRETIFLYHSKDSATPLSVHVGNVFRVGELLKSDAEDPGWQVFTGTITLSNGLSF